jgi:acid phosphatase type 7
MCVIRFQMPGAESGGFANFYFSFDYGNTHFTCMSTEFNYTAGSPQYAWLQQDLAKANSNRANVPWVIIVGHRPMVWWLRHVAYIALLLLTNRLCACAVLL